jgi:multidrug resistance efflux pump
MTAEGYLLSYPNSRFRGRVQGVGWALYQNNGASVQGLPEVEEILNWVRLSQRFPVRRPRGRGYQRSWWLPAVSFRIRNA